MIPILSVSSKPSIITTTTSSPSLLYNNNNTNNNNSSLASSCISLSILTPSHSSINNNDGSGDDNKNKNNNEDSDNDDYDNNNDDNNNDNNINSTTTTTTTTTNQTTKALTFRPVYTHQLFNNEKIGQYFPFPSPTITTNTVMGVCTSDSSNNNNSSSNNNDKKNDMGINNCNNNNNKHISITVLLSPSCESCAVIVSVSKPTAIKTTTTSILSPVKKMVRFINDDDEIQTSAKSDDGVSQNTTIYKLNNNDENGDMSIDDIISKMKLALPPIIYEKIITIPSYTSISDISGTSLVHDLPVNIFNHLTGDDILKRPIGKILCTYEAPIPSLSSPASTSNIDNKTTTYVITLANGNNHTNIKYFNNIQNLSKFFIETADNVDISGGEGRTKKSGCNLDKDSGVTGDKTNTNIGWGYWEVMYLFRKVFLVKKGNGKNNNNSTNNDAGSGDTIQNLRKRKYENDNNENDNKNGKNNYYWTLVGYITLRSFPSPFRPINPGTIMRICQALILPPYQKQGHGIKMLNAVYDLAMVVYDNDHKCNNEGEEDSQTQTQIKSHQQKEHLYRNHSNIVEVNVEDPSPKFQILRNIVDYQRLNLNVKYWLQQKYRGEEVKGNENSNNDNVKLFKTLIGSDLNELAAKMKITTKQATIAYEMYRLSILDKQIIIASAGASVSTSVVSATGGGGNDDTINNNLNITEMEAPYRLMIKRRLAHERKELILHAATTASSISKGKKELLAEWYTEIVKAYRTILNRRR